MKIRERIKHWLHHYRTESPAPVTSFKPDPQSTEPDRWVLAAQAGHLGAFWVDEMTEPLLGAQVGPGVIWPHPVDNCTGRPCVIHNPSVSHMSGWPMNWRSDRKLMERLCPHGQGHPDPDEAWYQENVRHDKGAVIHACDGCCTERSAA